MRRILNAIASLEYRLRCARLVQKHNDHTNKKEWALVSKSSPVRVLKWFGTEKPSDEAVAKEEARVQYFKHQG